jgi:hypothetical protein
MKESRIELPWAVPKKPGFAGKASGLYFWFYRTRKEAIRCQIALEREKKYTGPIEYRPGECYQLGSI